MAKLGLHRITEHDEIGYFAPRTWPFWRALIVCFCLGALAGHWLEIPYCLLMDRCFGIVSEGYPVWTDPWYHPYWVYGVGAVVMTLVIEPLKERLIMRRRTLAGAVLESFAVTVVLSMLLELVIGLLVNQPDVAGEYPYWDNSDLPLNVLGQAWLVNDVLIGLVAVVYVWVIFPLACEGFARLRPPVANGLFAILVIGFAACCAVSYLQLWLF
ncbi:putative ABC transporter permease [Adlercreutzia faecimuris]|uniref:ABC transporter permease n=1 Tax=Adlercreutzia faecimuris TaxID=2897341 RepID=A0ABS9WHY7_9ACTN|nr:putative ABC transporter permease [Adlercreutzia sp. JBNU-10]MCI2242160.1 putative ABC transporter permease [Adlercreutzia sp. JBNU-10]